MSSEVQKSPKKKKLVTCKNLRLFSHSELLDQSHANQKSCSMQSWVNFPEKELFWKINFYHLTKGIPTWIYYAGQSQFPWNKQDIGN